MSWFRRTAAPAAQIVEHVTNRALLADAAQKLAGDLREIAANAAVPHSTAQVPDKARVAEFRQARSSATASLAKASDAMGAFDRFNPGNGKDHIDFIRWEVHRAEKHLQYLSDLAEPGAVDDVLASIAALNTSLSSVTPHTVFNGGTRVGPQRERLQAALHAVEQLATALPSPAPTPHMPMVDGIDTAMRAAYAVADVDDVPLTAKERMARSLGLALDARQQLLRNPDATAGVRELLLDAADEAERAELVARTTSYSEDMLFRHDPALGVMHDRVGDPMPTLESLRAHAGVPLS